MGADETPAVSHVRAIPAMFLIDAEGRIVDQWLGKVDIKDVEKAVAKVVG